MTLRAEQIRAIEIDLQTATVYVRGERGVLLWKKKCGTADKAMQIASAVNVRWIKKLEGK